MIDGLTLWLLLVQLKGQLLKFAFGYPLALNLLRSAGAHFTTLLESTRLHTLIFDETNFTKIQLVNRK